MTMFRRPPDFVIGAKNDPYLLRWWIIPRNRWFNIYLHKILRDDDDRALHDHPWWNMSLILRGAYIEHMPNEKWRVRSAWVPVFRRATAAHRLELLKNCWRWTGRGRKKKLELLRIVPVWSLFITGPKIRDWGFYCPKGWKPWWEFVAVGNPGEVGPGCGD